jgi:hypothetical protein
VGTQDRRTHGWAPIPGINVLGGRPTSSDVHLYQDLATIDTDRPILLADSEGLSGGNQTPFGSFIDDAARYARYSSIPTRWKLVTHNKSRKVIPWKKESEHKITRAYCVEHIYPRILYAFSEVICYVIQQSPRIMETLISQMITWADKARTASLNQATLPRVILVLNNVSVSEQERADWQDWESATRMVIENLKRCTELGKDLQDIGNQWNRILDEKDQVSSVWDLFLRYFKSISIAYIPPRGKTQQAAEFYGKVHQLREKVLSLSDEVGQERLKAFNQLDSRCLESVFNIGIEHFFNQFDEPFDFFQILMINRPHSQSIVGNAINLMTKMEETEANTTMLDRRCARLFASYRTFMVLSEKMSGKKVA